MRRRVKELLRDIEREAAAERRGLGSRFVVPKLAWRSILICWPINKLSIKTGKVRW